MTRRLGMVVLLGLTTFAALLMWLLQSSAPVANTLTEIDGNADARSSAVRQGGHVEGPSPRPIDRAYRMAPTERAEVHRTLLAALARRTLADPTASSGKSGPSDGLPVPDLEDGEGSVGDEEMTQWNQVLMQHLSDELEPLTDECFQTAREHFPELQQYVALELTVLAEEEFGGLIEAVELGPENEADDAEFIECVRESILSIALPPPPFSGRKQILMSKHFGDD
jgi:hypothetical protein